MTNQNDSLLAWAELLKRTRNFFDSNGFLEVSTPYMVEAGAMEASIDTLTVNWSGGSAELHSSPEFEMKRLLAQSPRSIYQICRCFRDDPNTGIHWKEFTMLEFYRVNHNYDKVLFDMKQYLAAASGKTLAFEQLSVAQAFKEFAGIIVDWTESEDEFRRKVSTNGSIHLSKGDTWADIFFKVLVHSVEPRLPTQSPCILIDYPVLVSPLSAPALDGVTAQRFEIYWHGMEICNGCTELRDLQILSQRIEHENLMRTRSGKSPHPRPQTFIDSVAMLPPCAGVAVGLDRVALCAMRG